MSKIVPMVCQECKKNGAQISICRVRLVQFTVFNERCPRELDLTLKKPETQVLTVTYKTEWYDDLIRVIRQRMEGYELETIRLKHFIGVKLLEYRKYFGKPEYGSKTIAHLANDIGYSKADLYNCIQFAREYPDLDMFMSKFSNVLENFTWHVIVNEVLGRRKDRKEEFKPKVFNVWSFPVCDPRFGVEGYPWRIPGQIVQNVLYYFTKSKREKIVDPMAGSGTTWDVCKHMGYENCLCYDIEAEAINKLRKKHGKEACVRFNDIREGLPEEAKNADLIFLDPNYYNMLSDQFKNVEDFLSFLEETAKVCYDSVKPGGRVVILMADNTKGEFIYLRGKTYKIFSQLFGEPITVISVPFATEQASQKEMLNARDARKLLGRDRTLFVFKK